jgi:phosphoglycerol transferase MdoB-like AlkP superfamily enzyme
MLEAVTKNNDYSPKYVFLHSMITHKPFLFKLDGSATKYEDQQNCSNKSIYRNSYIYSKHKLLENIDMIIKSNSNSIIIVQSDHGPRFEELGNEWKKIFNAILIPGYTTGKHIQNGFSNIETYDYIFKNSQIIK